MLAVVPDAIGGGFYQGVNHEQIRLLKFDKCFYGSNSLTWGEAD
jgi:hypothetical protein